MASFVLKKWPQKSILWRLLLFWSSLLWFPRVPSSTSKIVVAAKKWLQRWYQRALDNLFSYAKSLLQSMQEPVWPNIAEFLNVKKVLPGLSCDPIKPQLRSTIGYNFYDNPVSVFTSSSAEIDKTRFHAFQENDIGRCGSCSAEDFSWSRKGRYFLVILEFLTCANQLQMALKNKKMKVVHSIFYLG